MSEIEKFFNICLVVIFVVASFIIGAYGIGYGFVTGLLFGAAGGVVAVLGNRYMDIEVRVTGLIVITFMVSMKWILVELIH